MLIIVVLGMLLSMFAGRLAIAARLDLHVAIVASTPQAARKRRGHRREHKDRPDSRLRRNHAHPHCSLPPSLGNRDVPCGAPSSSATPIAIAPPASVTQSDSAATRNDVNEDHGDDQHEQKVNEGTPDVKRGETEKPHYEKQYGESP
jgi:hypothetical protein